MIALCGMCGTALPAEGGCEACGAVRGAPKSQPETELLLVGVRCTFPCKACGFDSPLDELDGSGDAVCLKCGLHQVFAVEAWNEALPRLHALADLAGPDPEGSRRDADWSIVPTGFADLRQGRAVTPIEEGRLSIEAGPGHPLCESCREPVAIVVEGAGKVNTLCPGCGETASYDCQPDQFDVAVIGVIGLEHRIDRADAKRDSDQFLCGSCSAPLPVDGLGRLVRCAYCQAVSRIRVQQLQGLDVAPPPDLWWLVFEGASAQRGRLLRETIGAPGNVEIEDPEPGSPGVGARVLGLMLTAVALGVGSVVALGFWGLLTIQL